jgi:3-oxoacyl-[acyl-carrier protein] reductase
MNDHPTRVALVTGCGKAIGIGGEIARALGNAGIAVVVSDLSQTGVANDHDDGSDTDVGWHGLKSLVDDIVARGGVASWVQGDVASQDDAQRMVQETLARHGRLDILVNNAGAPHGLDRADIEAVPLEAWEQVMAVNVRGTFLMSRAAIGPMRRQRWGRLINIASAVVRRGARHKTAYVASKAAVVGFTQAVAMDVAAWGITANAICPGSIRTSRAISTTRKAGWTDTEAGLRERAKTIPLGRHGDVREIAAIAAFLASDASSYLTAQAIYVDGGGLPFVPPETSQS